MIIAGAATPTGLATGVHVCRARHTRLHHALAFRLRKGGGCDSHAPETHHQKERTEYPGKDQLFQRTQIGTHYMLQNSIGDVAYLDIVKFLSVNGGRTTLSDRRATYFRSGGPARLDSFSFCLIRKK